MGGAGSRGARAELSCVLVLVAFGKPEATVGRAGSAFWLQTRLAVSTGVCPAARIMDRIPDYGKWVLTPSTSLSPGRIDVQPAGRVPPCLLSSVPQSEGCKVKAGGTPVTWLVVQVWRSGTEANNNNPECGHVSKKVLYCVT